MKGDFSRLTFNPANHFSRVLMQQGRVTLDADQNEQAAITLHMLRTLARDLFGASGGPANGRGFGVYLADSATAPYRLMIGAGHYYVDGILCENDADCDYAKQPDYPQDVIGATPDPLLAWLANPTAGQSFWLYLDVWERHISWIEDGRIREPALGGPDTCSRTKVVWQVKSLSIPKLLETLRAQLAALQAVQPQTQDSEYRIKLLGSEIARLSKEPNTEICTVPLDSLGALSNAQMAARLDPGVQLPDPCCIPPTSGYRGVENQLYRVEIQQGGAVGDEVAPTFKWSRDNGSVAAAWLDTDGNDLIVSSARGFEAGNWVELSYDQIELQGMPGMLVQLAAVQADRLTVSAASIPQGQTVAWDAQYGNPKVRRWDQTDNDALPLSAGAVPITELSAADPAWISLEDGIQVQFAAGRTYRSGDYWLIPARVATGSIDWPPVLGADGLPEDDDNGDPVPSLQPPLGIRHHYAALGFAQLQPDATGAQIPSLQVSCRNCASPLSATNCGPISASGLAVRGLITFDRKPARTVEGSKKKAAARDPAPKKRPRRPARG